MSSANSFSSAHLGAGGIAPQLAGDDLVVGRQLLHVGEPLLAGERPAAAPPSRPPASVLRPAIRSRLGRVARAAPRPARRRWPRRAPSPPAPTRRRSAPACGAARCDARPLVGLDVDQEGARRVARAARASSWRGEAALDERHAEHDEHAEAEGDDGAARRGAGPGEGARRRGAARGGREQASRGRRRDRPGDEEGGGGERRRHHRHAAGEARAQAEEPRLQARPCPRCPPPGRGRSPP